MEIVNVVRFKISPTREQEMLDTRTVLLAAARKVGPGPRHTVLTRVDEETWMDVWHWDSEESLTATQAARLPEAEAAFGMVEVIDGTMGRIVSND